MIVRLVGGSRSLGNHSNLVLYFRADMELSVYFFPSTAGVVKEKTRRTNLWSSAELQCWTLVRH